MSFNSLYWCNWTCSHWHCPLFSVFKEAWAKLQILSRSDVFPQPRAEIQQVQDAVVQRSKGRKIKATWYFNASVFCLLVQSLRHSTESWCNVLITGDLTGLMWQDLCFQPKVTSQSNANCINCISISPNEEFLSHIMCWSAHPRHFQILCVGLSRRKSQSRSRNPVKTLSVLRELK